MTGQHEDTPRPRQARRQYGTFDELEAAAARAPRPMATAGHVIVIRTGAPLTIMLAPGSKHGEPTDVTADAMARIRAYIAAAHDEYAEYAAERDAARERRDR